MGNRNGFCLWGLELFFSSQSKEFEEQFDSRWEDIPTFCQTQKKPSISWIPLEFVVRQIREMVTWLFCLLCLAVLPSQQKSKQRPGGLTCLHKTLETMGTGKPLKISTSLPKATSDLRLFVSDWKVLLSCPRRILSSPLSAPCSVRGGVRGQGNSKN